MKTYQVEFRKLAFVMVSVEADTLEEAEEKGWKQLKSERYLDDALWQVELIEEVHYDRFQKMNEA